ncbi:unnamed protein product [Owenia fusiformis]|uniref:Fucosyltransferase n=1 Tax=Owenia fusiformis TaxID=6347 RepID=A0A8J1XVW1_OWEFU|nr:unnamed protein product [Owenia fusiformis]
MRIHPRRAVTLGIVICTVLVILFNLYYMDEWKPGVQQRPWGSDFDQGKPLKQVLQPFHEHVIREDIDANNHKGGDDKAEPPKHRSHFQIANYTYGEKYGEFTSKECGGRLGDCIKDHHIRDPNPPIWPADVPNGDRIVTQLGLVPDSVRRPAAERPIKKIIAYNGLGNWAKRGRQTLIDQNCPVTECDISDDRSKAAQADALLFQHSLAQPFHKRPPGQIWAVYFLESPYHTPGLTRFANQFNWTSTYRHDSDIVAPYEKFVPYNVSQLTKPQNKNYAAGKTKKVAWFVSNCGARNNRKQYAEELGKYIEVDIYGSCGVKKCPRSQSGKCFDMLDNDYKFYLSFENSNCRDYITEKFYVNGLGHNVIPIVMGAHPDDYKRVGPPRSFIHVDEFANPEALAKYLHKLDQDDNLYNEYFQWKGTGEFINTYWWCRMCSMVHAVDSEYYKPKFYSDVEKWWRGPDVCIGSGKWI